MDGIAVSVSIISTAMVIGNYVLVAIPGDNPKDACVVATWPSGSPGPTEAEVDAKIATHKADASAHHAKTTKASEITSERFGMPRLPAGTAGHVLTAQGAGSDPAYAAPAGGGTATKIQDADGDTKVDVEEGGDEDKVRMDVAGVEAFLLDTSGILDLAKQSRARAYLGSSQSITTATYTRVNLDTEVFDNQGEFDTTNHKFTATKAGYYLISASLAWDSYVADHEVLLAIYKNGAIIARANQAQTATTNAIIICASQIVYLAANDYVELYARHTFGSDTSLVEGDGYTHMAIHKLS